MSDLENYLLDKAAEASGTHLMPTGAPTHTDTNRSPTKTIRKTATELEKNEDGVPGEQVEKLPQAAAKHVRMDVATKNPSAKTAQVSRRWALPALARYPLDSYAHVKQASAYLEDNYRLMAPAHRHEYCVNLCKRAAELGIPLSKTASKYGSETYASDAEIEVALLGRASVVKEAMHRHALLALDEHRSQMQPEDFAVALGEFDKVAGIEHLYDSDILDPYFSTFGMKVAEDSAIQVDNDYIPVEDLRNFAQVHSCKLKDSFGDEFCDEFRKDPVGILKSLPKDQKKMVIRLASSTLTNPTST